MTYHLELRRSDGTQLTLDDVVRDEELKETISELLLDDDVEIVEAFIVH